MHVSMCMCACIFTHANHAHTHTVDDDACALAIEYHLVPDPDAKGLFKGSLRGKMQRLDPAVAAHLRVHLLEVLLDAVEVAEVEVRVRRLPRRGPGEIG